MNPKLIGVLVLYLIAIGGMAWYSRQKAVDFARQELRRQEELGTGYTPTGPRLNAMSGIFNPNPDGDPELQAQGIAAAASTELMQQLSARLEAVMAEEGPVGAVTVCADEAQQLTLDYSRMRGVNVRRVALKARNAANQPDDFERAWMQSVETTTADAPAAAEGVLIEGEGGAPAEYRYLTPIYLKPLCLTCHGTPEQIPAEVRSVLDERYPGDAATGFALGDFRGAVSVRVPFGE